MTIEQIKEKLKTDEYDFLRTEEKLGKNIVLLTVGGSHAYGTSNENSDLDIRGCALNGKREILTNDYFEQYVDTETDTTIYAFNKLVTLLASVNPNTIEMLGNKPEHYFYLAPVGQELLDHAHLFLSKRAIHTFGGYANQQLRRLENKSNRLVGQAENERHILKTIEHAWIDIKRDYFEMPEDAIRLYIDKAVQEGYESTNAKVFEQSSKTSHSYDVEIFMDINLRHYPLRDYKGLWSELNSIVRSYAKLGKRNEHAIEHGKLGKHMMHLIRLYMMCLDILEKERIVTYREAEHDLLMSIRNGEYLDDNLQPTAEFYEMLNEFEKRLDYASKNTNLPEEPNEKEIMEFVADVNERIVLGRV